MAFDTSDVARAFVRARGGDMIEGLALWNRVRIGIEDGELTKVEVDDKYLAKQLLKYIKSVNKNVDVYLNGKKYTGGFWG